MQTRYGKLGLALLVVVVLGVVGWLGMRYPQAERGAEGQGALAGSRATGSVYLPSLTVGELTSSGGITGTTGTFSGAFSAMSGTLWTTHYINLLSLQDAEEIDWTNLQLPTYITTTAPCKLALLGVEHSNLDGYIRFRPSASDWISTTSTLPTCAASKAGAYGAYATLLVPCGPDGDVQYVLHVSAPGEGNAAVDLLGYYR